MASAPHTRAQKVAYNASHPVPTSSILSSPPSHNSPSTPASPPSTPPSHNSSASDISSEFTLFVHKMPTSSSKKHVAICEQEGSKCPVLHPGDLDAEVFRKFEIACRNYVTNKDIAKERQTVKVMTALKDPCWEDWVKVHYDELKALTLKAFLTKFKDNFMPTDWEMDIRIELNVMSQNDHQSFRDFAVAVQNKNGLLKNTESHLNTAHLRTRIEAGMDPTLNKRSRQSDKKFHLIIDLQPWIEAVKELDDTLQMDRAECCAEMEAVQRASCQRTRDDRPLAEPSRKANILSTGSSNYSNPARKDWPPKLTARRETYSLTIMAA